MKSAAFFALISVIACASGSARPESAGYTPAEGTYDFSADIPGGAARGTLLVTADTFFMKQSQNCGIIQSSFTEIRVSCRGGGVSPSAGNYQSTTYGVLTFNRRSPGLSGSWSMQIPITRQRETCYRTEVRNGREVCVERRRENYTTYERRSGSVQVRRVP